MPIPYRRTFVCSRCGWQRIRAFSGSDALNWGLIGSVTAVCQHTELTICPAGARKYCERLAQFFR